MKHLQIITAILALGTKTTIKLVLPYLEKGAQILDIGAGTCVTMDLLRRKGYSLTPIDVANKSLIKDIQPIIYDGEHLPFSNSEFDIGLLLFVLHHTPDPEVVIREAMRVCKKLIIIEDIYNTKFGKFYTFFLDSVINLEFFNQPHSNRYDHEWQDTFKKLGLTLENKTYWTSITGGKHVIYSVTS